jgi:hypothetical protein
LQVQNWILQSNDAWDFDDLNNASPAILPINIVGGTAGYSITAGVLNIKRVEVCYDGSNYVVAAPIDIPTTESSQTAASYSEGSPRYDLNGNTITIYPTPANSVTSGIKIWADRVVTKFSYTSEANNDLLTGTKIPGFDENYHDILAMGTAYEWNSYKKNDKSLMNDIVIMKNDLQNHYGNKDKHGKLSMVGTVTNYE